MKVHSDDNGGLYRAVGTGPATHGKRALRKLCNTLLSYIKKQEIVEFMLFPSNNALERISEDPNIQKKFWWSMLPDWDYANC